MRIWILILLAPLLALADQAISYALTGAACTGPDRLPLHGLHLVFLVAAIAATVLAWQLRSDVPAAEDPVARRRRFLAGLATGTGVISVLAIAAFWIPGWVLSPCFG